MSFPTSGIGSEPRPLPSAGITQPPQYCGPFRHPIAPGLAVTGFQLVDPLTTQRGFPCCIDLPLVCMLSPLPRWNRKVHLSLSSSAISAFPEIMAGRLPHHVFRGLLGVRSRYGLHTRQVTFMTLYTEGSSRFVASTAAPIATGWNESCRVGFAPTERPCLRTAHKKSYVIPNIGNFYFKLYSLL